MPTQKKRLNMTLPPDVDAALIALSNRDDMAPSTMALHFLKLGLSIEEDDLWNDIAQKRDTPDAVRVSHEQAWS